MLQNDLIMFWSKIYKTCMIVKRVLCHDLTFASSLERDYNDVTKHKYPKIRVIISWRTHWEWLTHPITDNGYTHFRHFDILSHHQLTDDVSYLVLYRNHLVQVTQMKIDKGAKLPWKIRLNVLWYMKICKNDFYFSVCMFSKLGLTYTFPLWLEAVVHRCSSKQVLLRISQISQ